MGDFNFRPDSPQYRLTTATLQDGWLAAEKKEVPEGEEVSTRIVRAACRNTLLPERLAPDARLFGKIRSYGDARPCKLMDLTSDGMTVEFDEAQFAPCPGQRLVLYDEQENVVAGGAIQGS